MLVETYLRLRAPGCRCDRYGDADLRTVPGCALHIQRSLHQRDTLLHADQAKAGMSPFRVKADPAICDGQDDVAVPLMQFHISRIAPGVSQDVAERLLCYAVETEPRLFIKPRTFFLQVQPYMQSLLFKLAAQRMQPAGQTEKLQCGRVEVAGDQSDFVTKLRNLLLELPKLQCRALGPGRLCAYELDFEEQSGDVLQGAVVKFA